MTNELRDYIRTLKLDISASNRLAKLILADIAEAWNDGYCRAKDEVQS